VIIVEFSITPLGTGNSSLSKYVSEACKVVKNSGVSFTITPMGTIIETETLSDAFDIVRKAHEAVLKMGVSRVSTSIKIDDRRDKTRKMEDKVRALKI
jgi:uncharacterized protein (TIGR00106 family)